MENISLDKGFATMESAMEAVEEAMKLSFVSCSLSLRIDQYGISLVIARDMLIQICEIFNIYKYKSNEFSVCEIKLTCM